MPEKIEVSAADAIVHAGADCMLFVLQPETFPVFAAWLRENQPLLHADYTDENMREDLTTIYDTLVTRYLP